MNNPIARPKMTQQKTAIPTVSAVLRIGPVAGEAFVTENREIDRIRTIANTIETIYRKALRRFIKLILQMVNYSISIARVIFIPATLWSYSTILCFANKSKYIYIFLLNTIL